MMDLTLLILVVNIFNCVFGSSLDQPKITQENTALMYLSRYGYIDPSVSNPNVGFSVEPEKVHEAIKEFQAFAGLNQTGLLDEDTVKMMNTPRCGVVDKVGYGSNAGGKKRYALQGSRWKVNDLTYKITKYPKDLTKAEVDFDIKRAFEVWSEVTQLTFTAIKSGKIHIEIRFERGEHGDGDAFDGLGGTLAHAYFPIYGGDAHFDDSERWTVNSYKGTNLFQVAAHQFGHSLGLSHSDVQSSLMVPFYKGYQSRFALDEDDITGIQSLYGNKTKKTKKPSPTPSKPTGSGTPSGGGDPRLCVDGSFDAIVTMEDKRTYVFKGKYFWQLEGDGVASGYPRLISSAFEGLLSDLDAAFTWTDGKTYFFKGTKYWRSSGFKVDSEYPKLIEKGYPGIPNNVDAAFVWSGNGKIYFFKGSEYYNFDPTQKPPVSTKYPKSINIWDGIPNNIDDALQYSNGFTYFFKRGRYWRFNDRSFKVDSADPKFSRSVTRWWFGCPEKGSKSLYGNKTKQTKKPSPTPPKPTGSGTPSSGGDPRLCVDGSFDAIVTMEGKRTYVFKGKYFWQLEDDGVASGYPRLISSAFEGLSSDLDAAFTWTNGKTYFFKGTKYWRSSGFKVDSEYPKLIEKGYPGIPNNVDAAFVWSGNGKIYFFKGSEYYKFDPTQRPPVSTKYPKSINIWDGIPNNIDDALQYSNGFTYFFKRGRYWRFNDRSFKVDSADPKFSRSVTRWWFGCPEKGSQTDSDTTTFIGSRAQKRLRN